MRKYPNHFNDRLRKARRKRDLTQKELAALSGVARGGISKYECGKRAPRETNVERLARALCMPTAYLTGNVRMSNVGEQPCWTCAHLYDGRCRWILDLKAVDGWRIRRKTATDDGRTIILTQIDYCPEYVAEKGEIK